MSNGGIMSEIQARTLPRWNDLPDFDLYMDQVISLMERYLGAPANPADKGLTASMVNNYVKTGMVPAPVKKRYGRLQLACLIVICALKPVLPLSVIKEILTDKLGQDDAGALYDRFCEQFEAAERNALHAISSREGAADPSTAVVIAALSAQAQRNVALAYWNKG
jgi:hypothetical protein